MFLFNAALSLRINFNLKILSLNGNGTILDNLCKWILLNLIQNLRLNNIVLSSAALYIEIRSIVKIVIVIRALTTRNKLNLFIGMVSVR